MNKKLIKYTINTVVEAEDIVASVLYDNNITGCEIEDNVNLTDLELKEQYVDIPLKKSESKDAKVSFYVEIYDNEIEKNNDKNYDFIDNKNIDNSYMPSNDNKFTTVEIDEIMLNIIRSLHEYEENNYMGKLTIDKEDMTGFDYMNKWKEYFHKIYIDNICIKPSFEKLDDKDKDKIIINIDPKAAFGTGSHPTTKLCIKSIAKYNKIMNLKSLLDVGCGSAILGIVSNKLGIENVVSVDVDKSINDTILENIAMNNIDKNIFPIYYGNIIDDIDFRNKIAKNKYDIIVVNILAPVIKNLLQNGKIYEFLNNGGIIITSGIMLDKKDMIVDTINDIDCLEIDSIYNEDEWVNINIKYNK